MPTCSPHPHSHTGELLAASSADHKNSLGSFSLVYSCSFGQREKKQTNKKIPIKDLAGFDGERSYEKPRDDELLMSMNVLAT